MVRSNRIKEYRTPVTNLLADANGNIGYHTDVLNGLIQAVQLVGGTFGPDGSLFMYVSGTGETIWSMTSGTNTHNTEETFTVFPRATTVTTANETTSGPLYVEIPVNYNIYVVGSGLGTGSQGLGLNIGFI